MYQDLKDFIDYTDQADDLHTYIGTQGFPVLPIKDIYYQIGGTNKKNSQYVLEFMKAINRYYIQLSHTPYIFNTYECCWYRIDRKSQIFISTDFIEVMENVPDDIAGKLLFYIDVFQEETK